MKYFLVLICIIFKTLIICQPMYQVFSPKFSHKAGTYAKDFDLILFTESPKNPIYYSLDGTIPDTNSIRYTEPIQVLASTTDFRINAVAIDSAKQYSYVSSSLYRIDYQMDTLAALTWLSIQDFQNYLTGTWIGSNTNPWTPYYNVEIQIEANGHYFDKGLSCYKYPSGSEVCNTLPFYYGIAIESPMKKITVNSVNGENANGSVIVLYDQNGSSTTENLRNMRLLNGGNILQMEQWHFNQYGPIVFNLTRLEKVKIASIQSGDRNKLIQISPNPINKGAVFKIQTNEVIESIEVIDLKGNILHNQQLDNEFISLELPWLEAGVYFINTHLKSGAQYLEKVIVFD